MTKFTISDLLAALLALPGNMQVEAHFDFPLQGVKQNYKVSGVDDDGRIVLYNVMAKRPMGHE